MTIPSLETMCAYQIQPSSDTAMLPAHLQSKATRLIMLQSIFESYVLPGSCICSGLKDAPNKLACTTRFASLFLDDSFSVVKFTNAMLEIAKINKYSTTCTCPWASNTYDSLIGMASIYWPEWEKTALLTLAPSEKTQALLSVKPYENV